MLVKQSLEEYKSRYPKSSFVFETTAAYFEDELPESDLHAILLHLSETTVFLDKSWACLVMGYGSHRKRTYDGLRARDGVEVLWSGVFLPWWAYPIGLIAASYGGLIMIRSPAALSEVFGTLSQLAMVELFVFKSSLLEEVRSYVLRHKGGSQIAQIVHKDEGYFCFGVDGDNPGSTSVRAWCSYGRSCPEELSRVIETYGREKT